jgi:hypothetical protein
MGTGLHDIQPNEVSLVRRGANRRTFLLAKSDEVDQVLVDALAVPAEREADLLEAVRKAGGDEELQKAAAAYARVGEAIRESFGDDGIPEPVLKAMRKQTAAQADLDDEIDSGAKPEDDLDDETITKAAEGESEIYKRDFTTEQRRQLAKNGHALPDGSYPIESKADLGPALTLARSGHGDVAAAKALIRKRAKELGAEDQLPDDLKKEATDMTDTATVPVRKEDGTWDLSAVPEDQRPALELVLKAHDDELVELRKEADDEKSKADEAIEIAKSERETRETREYIAKSEQLDQLAKDDSEFGKVLKSIGQAERDGHLPEGTGTALDEVLKAANEAVEKGALFAENGRGGHGGDNSEGWAKVEAAAAELRKADPSLSKEQAVAKALEDDPSLYDETRREEA